MRYRPAIMKFEKNGVSNKRVDHRKRVDEILSCVDHQFCFCKECVVLDNRKVQANKENEHKRDMVKISCGSMVRFHS